jgi:hypothetical protein
MEGVPRRGLDEPLEARVPVGEEMLRRQALQLLAPAYLRLVVRAHAEEAVVVIVRVLMIHHVRAAHAVEHVDIVHGVPGSLEVEIVEIQHGQDEHVGLEHLEEPLSTAPEPMRNAWSPGREADGRATVFSEVTWHTVRDSRSYQEVDERLQMVPVLMALRVEDDRRAAGGSFCNRR